MNQNETSREADMDSLAAELAGIPKECWRQILREAVIFIAGMERVRTLDRERIRGLDRGG